MFNFQLKRRRQDSDTLTDPVVGGEDSEATESDAPAWWTNKKVIIPAVAGCVASVGFFTGWGAHLGDSTYLTRSYGTVGAAADGMYSGLDDLFGLHAQIKGDDGHGGSVTYNGSDSMGVTDKGLLFAPKPSTEFHNASCPTYPTAANGSGNEPPSGMNGRSAGWWAPSLKSRLQVTQGANVFPSGFSNNEVTLPAAPNGVWYASGSPLSSNTGASILAGHINLNDGNLSPWGYLHRLSECSHVFMNDETGTRHELVITGMYLVKQEDLASHTELWRKDGDKKVYLITCSGASIGEDGTSAASTFLFNYEYNLVVEGTPVDGAYPKPTPTAEGVRKPVVTEIPSTETQTPAPTETTASPAATPEPAPAAPVREPATSPTAIPTVEATPAPAATSETKTVAPISRTPVKAEATTGTVVVQPNQNVASKEPAKSENRYATATPTPSPTASPSASTVKSVRRN